METLSPIAMKKFKKKKKRPNELVNIAKKIIRKSIDSINWLLLSAKLRKWRIKLRKPYSVFKKNLEKIFST